MRHNSCHSQTGRCMYIATHITLIRVATPSVLCLSSANLCCSSCYPADVDASVYCALLHTNGGGDASCNFTERRSRPSTIQWQAEAAELPSVRSSPYYFVMRESRSE